MKYLIFNGYTLVGEANTVNEVRNICTKYCEDQGVSFEFKRELYSEPFVMVLIYQYRTLYLETFVITENYEIEKQEG